MDERVDLSRGLRVAQVEFRFPTPILNCVYARFEALNPRLLAVAERVAREQGFVAGSLEDGGSTPHDLHLDADPAVQELLGFCAQAVAHLMCVEKVEAMGLSALDGPDWLPRVRVREMWVSRVVPGNMVMPHAHADALWTGVYYVDPGGDPDEVGGRFHVLSPAPAAARTGSAAVSWADATLAYDPLPGLLLVFPGYLQHFVDVYRGERPRIAIAFNAEIIGASVTDNRGDMTRTRRELGMLPED